MPSAVFSHPNLSTVGYTEAEARAKPGIRPVALAATPGETVSPVAIQYLNRLSDLLWTMARWQEGESRPVSSL